jgi:hypothetical protein
MINPLNLLRLPTKRVTQKQYDTIKYITISYGAISAVLDLYTAYLFGQENFPLAFLMLVISIVLTLVDSTLWVWVLEQMAKKKVEHGKRLKKNGSK